MSVYGDHVLPRIIDVACNMKVARAQRRRVCAGLTGDVVEIGPGVEGHAAGAGPFPGYEVNREPFLEVIRMHRDSVSRIDRQNIPEPLHRAAQACWDEAYELGPAEPESVSYADLARRFGISEAQVTNHLHQARRRFQEILIGEVSAGVTTREELERELRDLFSTR